MSAAVDRLRTVREIARGGLGYVELVVRLEGRFERVCAVKRPHTHLLGQAKMVEAFLEEGRVAGLLRHPNVVPVLDVGEDERGPYMLMDFVEGVSLTQLVKHVARRGDLLPISVILQIARQAAEGLRVAHELVGVDGRPSPMVHRDVSPQNLLIGYDAIVRVADFGIAKVLTAETPETTAAVLKGKYGYMAPEQLRFEELDARVDLFALGVTMFEALIGQRLYRGGGIEQVARRILKEPPPDLSDHRGDAPPGLERLLYDMLAKNRDHRIGSARLLIERLEELTSELRREGDWIELADYLETELGAQRDAERLQRAAEIEEIRSTPSHTEIVRRRRRVRGGLLGVAALALVIGAFVWTSRDPAPVAPVVPEIADIEVSPAAPEMVEPPRPTEVVASDPEPPRMRRRPARMRTMRQPAMSATSAMTTKGLENEFWD